MAWQCQRTGIEALEEIIRLLRITKKYILDKNKTTELGTLENILTESVLALAALEQAVMPKSIVPDPWWFDSDQIKFKD